MEKKHNLDCVDCENESRTIKELKSLAINHFRNTELCKICGKEKPFFLKITYKTIPFADKIDQDYIIFHNLVLASKDDWKRTDGFISYCYNCYEREKNNFESLPDKGEYVEFLEDY